MKAELLRRDFKLGDGGLVAGRGERVSRGEKCFASGWFGRRQIGGRCWRGKGWRRL